MHDDPRSEVPKDINPHAPGIYFGMPERDYHADPSLGSHSIIRLLTSPEDWKWDQADNPLREFEPDSSALKFGRAVHALVLEGTQSFESRFTRKPTMPEGCLITGEQLKEHCRKLGLKVTGTKAELAERIRTVDNHTPLEPEITAEFEKNLNGKTVLSENEWARIVMAQHNIVKNTYNQYAFTDGMPEVSVFWLKNNVPVKCRIDYLRPEECVDLKSTATWRGENIKESWARTVRTRRYDMQASHYLEGREMISRFIAEGNIKVLDGPKPRTEWLDAVARAKNISWLWVVYQSEGAPISQAFRAFPGSYYMQRATMDCERSIQQYKLYKAAYGNGLWVRNRDVISMADEDFAPWWLNRPEL